MKAVFLTEAGKTFGWGHLTRCLALANALGKNLRQEFILHGDKSVKDFFENHFFPVQCRDWLKDRKFTIEKIKSADLIVVDSYHASESFFEDLNQNKGPFAKVLAIDDYQRINYQVEYLVNPSIYGDRLNYRNKDSQLLLGPKYILLRKEFWAVRQKKTKSQIENVLITLGGMKQGRFLETMVLSLARRYPGINFFVIFSQKLKVSKLRNIHVIAQASALRMKELMLNMDCCVSGGGQTLHELARVGVPMVAVGVAENQRLNLIHWQKRGFLQKVIWKNSKNFIKDINRSLESLSSEQIRKSISAKARSLVDGQGALRIAQEIQQDFKIKGGRLRKFTKQDCLLLYRWRNHPKIRPNFLNSAKVSLTEHKQWFDKVLKNEDVCIYIAEDERKIPLGSIRFNRLGRKYFVSVNVAPRLIGKGIGYQLIKAGTRSFIQDHGIKSPILADIKRKNAGSMKAFSKAGYKKIKNNNPLFFRYMFNPK